MRARWLILAGLVVPLTAHADSEKYEQIRVDGGLTGSWVGVHDRNGSGMVVEIKAMVTDMLAIGGRVEVAVMFGGLVGNDDVELGVAMAACGLAKAEYFLLPGPIRPFIAFGAGGYTIGSQSIDNGPDTTSIHQQTGRYFGVAPQIGIDLGPVRLAATYNAILGASLELHQMIGSVEHTEHVSQNYLSLELSFRFAGGERRKPPPPMQPIPPEPLPQGPPGQPM